MENYAAAEPKPFSFFDNEPDTGNRKISFSSDESPRLRASSDTKLMKGNYAMASLEFLQVYVIRIPIGNIAVSTVFVCLQSKTQDPYEALLQAVMDCCHEIYPSPKIIIFDFELAISQAVNNDFEQETRTQGCFYHLTQSTQRKSWPYQTLQKVWRLSSIVWTDRFIAFLQVEYVPAGMQLIKARCPDEATSLITSTKPV